MSVVCLALLNTISGSIEAISRTTIIINSDRGRTDSVEIGRETRFVKSNLKSRAKGPKVRDRVVVDVHETEGKLVAVEIRYGRPKSQKAATSELASSSSTIESPVWIGRPRGSGGAK